MQPILVSVLISAYNEEQSIARSVKSVLTQDYRNLEVLVINDGSTDGTAAALAEIRDDRLRVIHKSNTGLVDSLNFGISVCKGRYIARQDADDTSAPSRITKQLAVFAKNNRIVLCGTWATLKSDLHDRLFAPPVLNQQIKDAMQQDNQFVHSSIMFESSLVRKLGGYPPIWPCEDYRLWLEFGKHGEIINIPEVLVTRYISPDHLLSRPFYSGLKMKNYYLARLKCQLRAAAYFGPHWRTIPYLCRSFAGFLAG